MARKKKENRDMEQQKLAQALFANKRYLEGVVENSLEIMSNPHSKQEEIEWAENTHRFATEVLEEVPAVVQYRARQKARAA